VLKKSKTEEAGSVRYERREQGGTKKRIDKPSPYGEGVASAEVPHREHSIRGKDSGLRVEGDKGGWSWEGECSTRSYSYGINRFGGDRGTGD